MPLPARVTLFAAAVLVLAGCAGVSPGQAPALSAEVDVPRAWSAGLGEPSPDGAAAALSTPVLASWWQTYDDPLLAALVAQSLRANTTINAAQATLRQARALRDAAAATLWPRLQAGASVQHSSAGGHSAGTTTQASLDVGGTFDVFGGLRSGVEAADAAAGASAAALGDAQVAIAVELALDYLALRSAQARLQIASDNLASQQETLQIVQWREEAGLSSALESEQARAIVAQTAAQLPVLRTGIEQSAHAVAVLIGQPPAVLLPRLADARPLPLAALDPDAGLPVDALARRADVAAAALRVQAAEARLAQAEAARAPTFTYGGTLGVSALSMAVLTHGESVVSSLVASANLPLFDGGALRAEVQAQQAALEIERVGLQAARLAALRDVEDARTALRDDRLRLAGLRAAAVAAERAAAYAQQRYRSGLVDFQVVLDTQRGQLAAQDGVASAAADVGADQIRLFRALGGGWRDDGSLQAGRQ